MIVFILCVDVRFASSGGFVERGSVVFIFFVDGIRIHSGRDQCLDDLDMDSLGGFVE